MKKYTLFISLAATVGILCHAAEPVMNAQYVPSEENLAARKEFESQRFGIFIHWGIYSMLGQGEWVLNSRQLKHSEYRNLAAGFYPSRFDASQWASIIKQSGARYVTFTSRHHDGFSMWDTDQSSYNIMDASPFKRDIVGELAKSLGDEGISLHLYYSHLDWGRDDYWPRGRTGLDSGRPEGNGNSWQHYIDFMEAQLTELLTKYGPIGGIWFDGVWDMDAYPYDEQPGIWHLEHQYALIHSLQPACLVGNNHHLFPFPGEDIQMFERDIPGQNLYGYSEQEISRLPLETCQTMNDSWGYRITDTNYKDTGFLIRYLAQTASKGANLLLNIGPRPDGTIPEEAVARLKAIGEWLQVNGESIYGTKAGYVPEQQWGVTTQKDNTLYLHLFGNDAEQVITFPVPQGSCAGKSNKAVAVRLLDAGKPCECKPTMKCSKDSVTVSVPADLLMKSPDVVVAVDFKRPL